MAEKNAPARIWATVNGMRTSMSGVGQYRIGGWSEYEHATRATEYVRADVADKLAEALKALLDANDAVQIADELDAATTQPDVDGLVRRLQALQEHLRHQPLTHADAVDIETIGEAASALAAERAARRVREGGR